MAVAASRSVQVAPVCLPDDVQPARSECSSTLEQHVEAGVVRFIICCGYASVDSIRGVLGLGTLSTG
jgi:hypothetical protein